MPRIIVSYRRSDTAAIAGRIFDRLAAHYGEENVFMDIDKIPFGTDFREHIKKVLLAGDVLLAVIGPNWLGTGTGGRSRIMDAADPVRVEVETALWQGITVIPLLVEDAIMPGAAELPESLADFAFINAAPVDVGRDFRSHMDRLIRSMDAMFATRGKATAAASAPKQAKAPRSRIVLAAAGVAVLLLVAVAAVVVVGLLDQGERARQAAKVEPESGPAAPSPEPMQRSRTGPALDTVESESRAPNIPAPASTTYRVLATVSDGIQNLRSGPALKYPLVISIPAGAGGITVGACRKAEDNTKPWCAATWRKYSGWISSCCIVSEKTGAPPRLEPPSN